MKREDEKFGGTKRGEFPFEGGKRVELQAVWKVQTRLIQSIVILLLLILFYCIILYINGRNIILK